jgi:hypothetical protein
VRRGFGRPAQRRHSAIHRLIDSFDSDWRALLVSRQRDREAGAPPGLALREHPPAVPFGNRLADRETETRSPESPHQ